MRVGNEVYYKIIKAYDRDWLTIACLQWFDELDVDEDRYFKDDDGNVLQFDSEDGAKEWLNSHVKPQHIDPDYRSVNHEDERRRYLLDTL